MASFSALKEDVFARQERRQHYESYVMGLNAYDRHKKFMSDYANYCKEDRELQYPIKTDYDTLRESYRFLRSEEDDAERSWEQRLAKRYYDKLFKEYCIADMSRYKEIKIGLRWRIEKEVVVGKGQFVCGNKKCIEKDNLCSYEVNFAYKEAGQEKQALVKLRVCPECALKLNYRKEKEKKRQQKLEEKKRRKETKRRKLAEDSGGRGGEEEAEEMKKERKKEMKKEMKKEDEEDDFNPYFKGMFL